jgi:hypothetical protein
MDNTTRRILAGIVCEVGQLDGTIAMLQEARDRTERPEVRKEVHMQVLDELSRRNGLYRALRTPDRRRRRGAKADRRVVERSELIDRI